MTASERRQAILELLCQRRRETRENLAFEFGVSKRTIEYDVLQLSLAYPIYTTQGNGGGIHVLQKVLLTLSGEEKETMQQIIKTYGGLKR